jgi:hypothetical protein
MTKQLLIGILILVFATFNIVAENTKEIENDLVQKLDEIQKWSSYGGNYDEEKLLTANESFRKTLAKYAVQKIVLEYPFPKLKGKMQIATSPDGKFRVYSWDTEMGGTMHDFDNLYQFIGSDGKISTEERVGDEDDFGGFTYDVFEIDTKAGRVYLDCSTFIGSTMDRSQSLTLRKIVGSKLDRNVKLIKTASGITDSLGIEYNFFSVVDRKERPIKLFSYDAETKTIKFPVVVEDAKVPIGKVTGRFIYYRFDGNYFVKVKR